MNKVIVSGRLVKDPVVKTLPSGTTVTKFSIAVNKRYKGKDGEWKEVTDYLDIETFGRLSERSKLLKKGYLVNIEGRLKQEKWISKSGQKKSNIKIIANKIYTIQKPQKAVVNKEKVSS